MPTESPDLDRVDTLDTRRRALRSLRISVTDRCNLRCGYCMPEKNYKWLPRDDILSFEEIDALVGVFADLGVDRVRLTGGEPLIRKNLPDLVAMLARRPQLRDLAMTTNGIYLPEHGADLLRAGLRRVTVSLDSLDRDRFARMAGRDKLDATLAGIEHAAELGFALKINTVVIRGQNDGELAGMIEFGRRFGAEVRFIEYMDVGGATAWKGGLVVSRDEILRTVRAACGPVETVATDAAAPARRWRLADGTTFGIIASTTVPFCGACDRSRLTADGMWYLCLYGRSGVDLRQEIRAGASHDQLVALVRQVWERRADRGAEERHELDQRSILAGKAN